MLQHAPGLASLLDAPFLTAQGLSQRPKYAKLGDEKPVGVAGWIKRLPLWQPQAKRVYHGTLDLRQLLVPQEYPRR